jgi:streptomycin 6-kinase
MNGDVNKRSWNRANLFCNPNKKTEKLAKLTEDERIQLQERVKIQIKN